MKTGKLYRQVFIESEDDLPKEDGEYFVSYVNIECKLYILGFNFLKTNIQKWLTEVDWYLLPVEQSQQIELLKHEHCFQDGVCVASFFKIKFAFSSSSHTSS